MSWRVTRHAARRYRGRFCRTATIEEAEEAVRELLASPDVKLIGSRASAVTLDVASAGVTCVVDPADMTVITVYANEQHRMLQEELARWEARTSTTARRKAFRMM